MLTIKQKLRLSLERRGARFVRETTGYTIFRCLNHNGYHFLGASGALLYGQTIEDARPLSAAAKGLLLK